METRSAFLPLKKSFGRGTGVWVPGQELLICSAARRGYESTWFLISATKRNGNSIIVSAVGWLASHMWGPDVYHLSSKTRSISFGRARTILRGPSSLSNFLDQIPLWFGPLETYLRRHPGSFGVEAEPLKLVKRIRIWIGLAALHFFSS